MAATREFGAIRRARRAGVPVPKPIAQNRHLIVMGMFEGSELSKIPFLPDPKSLLRRILLKLRRLFSGAHLVHGDLSEYNVLMNESGQFAFIDWPQSVSRHEPGAEALLKRDVSNMVNFFRKKHQVSITVQEALDFVQAKKRALRRI